MSCHLETFENMKTKLQKAVKVGGVEHDFYSHVTEIFDRIMLHHPYDAYDKFEEISHLIKKTHLKI